MDLKEIDLSAGVRRNQVKINAHGHNLGTVISNLKKEKEPKNNRVEKAIRKHGNGVRDNASVSVLNTPCLTIQKQGGPQILGYRAIRNVQDKTFSFGRVKIAREERSLEFGHENP